MKAMLKFFAKSLLTLIFLFFLFLTLSLGILQTKEGQTWFLTHLVSYLENKTNTQIQMNEIRYSFPMNLRVKDIKISKDNQSLLSIDELEILGNFPKLFQGKLVFSTLRASNVLVNDIINDSSKNELSHLQGKPQRAWDALLVPFYLKIENIDIQKIQLSSTILKTISLSSEIKQEVKSSFFNLNGMISNNPFRSSIAAHLLITAKNNNLELMPCSLGIDAQNHQLSFSFHCNQFPLQVIKDELPSQMTTHIALYGNAPMAAWQNLAQDTFKDDFPIEGNFKISLHLPLDDPSILSTLIEQETLIRGHYHYQSNHGIDLFDFKINNSNLSLEGKANVTTRGEIRQAHFKGDIENLARFQHWLGKDVQGKLAFKGEAEGSIQSIFIASQIESPLLTFQEQNFPNFSSTFRTTLKDKVWGGYMTLQFDHQNTPWMISSYFDGIVNQYFALHQLQIDAYQSRLEGEITTHFPEFIWDGALEAKINNLQNISHLWNMPLTGKGHFYLNLGSTLDSNKQRIQTYSAKFIGNDLKGNDWQIQNLTLHFEIDPLQNLKEFFQVKTYAEGQQSHWKDYSIDQFKSQATYQIDLSQKNLTELSIEWNADNIKSSDGQASKSSGEAKLKNPLQAMEGSIRFAFQDFRTPLVSLENIQGSTVIHLHQSLWPFYLNGQGMLKDQLVFSVEGAWHFQQDSLEIQANLLKGQFGPYPLQLLQPVHFSKLPHATQISSLNLRWGEAELKADFKLEQEKLFGRVKTNAMPSELFYYAYPELPLVGRVSLEGFLEGSLQNPQGKFQIDLHHVQINEDLFAQKPFIAGRLNLELNQHVIQLTSDLKGIGRSPLLISGYLPIELTFSPFIFKINGEKPFDLSLNAEGELDPYLHLFYNDATNLSGQAKIALKLNGSFNAPKIQGYIDLINGAYESLSTGALYHNIQGRLEGDGTKIVLTKFSAQDSKQGAITATGAVAIDAKKYFPFDFKIQPSHIFILDSDYASISASGSLDLIGNIKKSKLQGRLTVDQAVVHLEEALPHQIKTVDVKHINLPNGKKPSDYSDKNEKMSSIDLDIKLDAPNNVMIKDIHLNSDWKGSIEVTGNLENPQLHGDLRVTRGEYDFNGKIFNLTQGNIHFAGSPGKKTTLYVVASKDIDRIRAEIIVKGSVNKPVINFRSNPPLSQREVLSYILFNRGISDITSDQGDQLSQSFISLNSSEKSASSDDFLSRLRNNIGIDRLDFTAHDEENNDIGLEVGKNITENISLTVNQSMASPPVIAVEAKLLKNIKMQAAAGVNEDAPVRMSIKWKKDY